MPWLCSRYFRRMNFLFCRSFSARAFFFSLFFLSFLRCRSCRLCSWMPERFYSPFFSLFWKDWAADSKAPQLNSSSLELSKVS